jgi:hypothetical protein
MKEISALKKANAEIAALKKENVALKDVFRKSVPSLDERLFNVVDGNTDGCVSLDEWSEANVAAEFRLTLTGTGLKPTVPTETPTETPTDEPTEDPTEDPSTLPPLFILACGSQDCPPGYDFVPTMEDCKNAATYLSLPGATTKHTGLFGPPTTTYNLHYPPKGCFVNHFSGWGGELGWNLDGSAPQSSQHIVCKSTVPSSPTVSARWAFLKSCLANQGFQSCPSSYELVSNSDDCEQAAQYLSLPDAENQSSGKVDFINTPVEPWADVKKCYVANEEGAGGQIDMKEGEYGVVCKQS